MEMGVCMAYIGRMRLIPLRGATRNPDVPRTESPSSTLPNLGPRGECARWQAGMKEEKGQREEEAQGSQRALPRRTA